MKKQNRPNNYDKWIVEWRQRFLSMDQEQLLKKLPELREEGDYLTLFHFHQKYGVDRRTGEIAALDGPKEISLNARLNIYTLLWYCTYPAFLKQEWVPFRDLKDASPFGPAFQKNTVQVLARTFSGHMKELSLACEALGGKKLPMADTAYQLEAFRCIPMRLLFWDGDDEFPAQANLLFDKNATDFIHVESITSIAAEGLSLLSSLSGLPLIKML